MHRLSSFSGTRASLFGLRVSSWIPESDVFASIFSLHASTGNSWLMHAVRFSGLMHHFLKKKSCSADGVPPGAPAAEAALHNFFPFLSYTCAPSARASASLAFPEISPPPVTPPQYTVPFRVVLGKQSSQPVSRSPPFRKHPPLRPPPWPESTRPGTGNPLDTLDSCGR